MHAATWTLPALIFITAGAGQMALWARAKHVRLRKACSNFLLHLYSLKIFMRGVWHVNRERACAVQTFDGKDGREKYPKRWIMLPPFF